MSDQKNQGHRDYLAIAVFVTVLVVFIVSAFYLVRTMRKQDIDDPVKIVFRWVNTHIEKYLEKKKDIRPQGKKDRKLKRHFTAGRKFYNKRMYNRALQEFDQAVKIDPSNFRAFYWRGRVYLKMGHYNRATADFKMVVKLKPHYARPYHNLGWLYYQKGKYEESIQYLNKAIELEPNNGWAYYTRGRSHFKKGDLQSGLRDTKKSCGLGYQQACSVQEKYENEGNKGNL
ncbi:MAG: tetratricopeptide repeat protein [Deltaproteobacteria bacterium]|nr:tetratricopeptide repeat protein [Deltaproteobacteria bacterium]